MSKRSKISLALILVITIAGGALLYREYSAFMAAPTTRLTTGESYREMPADQHHLYIELPIDHTDPSRGTFTAFYILSPNFKSSDSVVFMLFDNQQEAVGMVATTSDFEYFDDMIGKHMSYVLIGNRGVSPTLFPETFNKNGSVNFTAAVKLYGSKQQIEDIEAIRKDMERRGLLSTGGKISVMGGSGGGVLVQQFLDTYGEHVSRALILSTGAPDLSAHTNTSFAKSLYEINPKMAAQYYELIQAQKASPSLAWVLFKRGLQGDIGAQERILNAQLNAWDFNGKLLYLKNLLNVSQNFPLIRFIMSSPQELEVRERMWELIGPEVVSYDPQSAEDVNLMLETCKEFLSDFMAAYRRGEIPLPSFIMLDRSKYQGEVMVWANTGDQDFGVERARLIQQSYPHSALHIFDVNVHHTEQISEYQKNLLSSFFRGGLYSNQTQQLLKEGTQ